MLFALTQQKHIKEANNDFFKKLSKLSHKSIKVKYTTAGKSTPIVINYSKKYKFWWGHTPDLKGKRYWNPFGLGEEPHTDSNVVGPCQFNCVYEGFSNLTGGLFAIDEDNNYYLLHSGRLGGGKKGVGKERFTKFYFDHYGELEDVICNERVLKYFVVTNFNDKNFYQNILDYINIAQQFKDSLKVNTHNEDRLDRNPLTNGEYIGIKTYDLPQRTIIATNDHARIVNQLIDELRLLGLQTKRDQFRDAYTIDNNGKVDRIFEVKTGFNRQKLYTAVGQLIVNSLTHNSEKFFVLEKDAYADLIEDLGKIPVKCVTYKWNADKLSVKFYGLKVQISNKQ